MFTRQAQQLHENLWQGGLSAPQANAIANALGQCRATLEHRGPIQLDYTSPKMKLIQPESADIEFPDIQLQPPESFPPKQQPPPNFEPPEERPLPQQNPLPPPNGPTYPDYNNEGGIGGSINRDGCCVPDWLTALLEDAYDQWEKYKKDSEQWRTEHEFTDGLFIEVDDTSLTINLKTSNEATGNICTFGNDTIDGTSPDDFFKDNSDALEKAIDDAVANDTVGTNVTVITGVTLSGDKLTFATQGVKVLSAGTPGTTEIGVTQCN